MRTNSGLTVYNRYISSGAEKWQRVQIAAVQWENNKGSNVLATGGTIAANQATIYIPMAGATAGYLQPKAWQALTNKSGFWTLQVGDYVVKGLLTAEIVTTPTPYTLANLKEDYDDVLQIASVDTKDFGSESMQHWQIGAK